MADKKLTELEEATSIADTDLLYVSSGGVSKKIQASKIIATEQISNITACGQNVIGLIKNGRVYTATSNATTYTADATGRGLSTSINTNDLYSSGFIQVPIPTSSPVIKLLLNHSDMFALCENGELYVWGKNTSKCLGLNHANIVPFPVLSNTNVIDIYGHASNGEYEGYMYNQMIIKKDDGKFYGVGTNYQGAFGLGNTTALSVWTELTGLGINNIAKLFNLGTLYSTTVALTVDGRIIAAGNNTHGALGVGDQDNRTTFVDITTAWTGVASGIQDIKVDYATYWHDGSTTAIRGNLFIMYKLADVWYLKASGNNAVGQLGNGTTTQSLVPVSVLNSTGVVDFHYFTGSTGYFLKSDGTLWGWGYNGYGQVGNNSITNVLTPVQVLTDVKSICNIRNTGLPYAQRASSVVSKTDGTMWSCGSGYSAKLGIGTTGVDSLIFTQMKIQDELVDIGTIQVGIATIYTISKTTSGKLYGWGYPLFGTKDVTYPSLFKILS